MSNFYAMEPEDGILFGTKWAYAELVEPVNRGPSEKCPVCGGAVGGRKWLPPHRVKLSRSHPNGWGDFVWGAGFPLLVSARFKAIYEAEGLSGIAEFHPPVEIVRLGTKKAEAIPLPLPLYHLVHIPWGGANQDDAASGLVHEQPQNIKCSYCRSGFSWRKQDRIVIEEGSWNGSDIFIARNAPAQIIVSERFKQVAEKYAFKNCWLIPLEKYGHDERRRGHWYIHE